MRSLASRVAVVAVVAVVGGCDGIFDLERVPSDAPSQDASGPDAPSVVCVADDFAGGLDLATWQRFGAPGPRVDGGQLVIDVPATGAGAENFGGIFVTSRSLEGLSLEAEIVEVPATLPTEASIQIRHTADAGNRYTLSVEAGVLLVRHLDGGTLSKAPVQFDPTEHRFVRIRHDTATHEMVYEVRSAMGAWTELKRYPVTAPLADSYFELFAGSYDTAPATRAVFDNVLATGACEP